MSVQTYDGKFVLADADADNFEAWMAQVGVNWVLRKAGKAVNQTVVLELLDNKTKVNIKTISTVKSSNDIFEFGVEREYKTMDGRKVMATAVYNEEDNSVTLNEYWDSRKRFDSQIYKVNQDLLSVELKCDGKSCRRTFRRVQA